MHSWPGACFQRLNLKCDESFKSNFAFNFNLRHYNKEIRSRLRSLAEVERSLPHPLTRAEVGTDEYAPATSSTAF
jgi:hypothetical protein